MTMNEYKQALSEIGDIVDRNKLDWWRWLASWKLDKPLDQVTDAERTEAKYSFYENLQNQVGG